METQQQFLLFLLLGSFPHTFPGVLLLPFRLGGKIKAGGTDCEKKFASLVRMVKDPGLCKFTT